MEPHNHISITPFPFSLLSHAMLLLHVKKQSQIALDAHLFPIPVTWQWTGPAGLSPQQGTGCYQWLRFEVLPFYQGHFPGQGISTIAQRLGCSLPCHRSVMGCYRSEATSHASHGTLAMRVKSNHVQPTHTPCRITEV